MKTFIHSYKSCFIALLSFAMLIHTNLQAQICMNPADTVYGLNSIVAAGTGQIVGINAINAGTRLIGTAAAASANANGLGFSKFNGRFYFFNQSGGGATEFVSFNALTGSKMALSVPASPALPTASTGKIRSGTMNSSGLGYYTIFPGATTAMGYAKTGPAFYYYDVALDKWTLITQTFKDVSGNVVTPIQSLNSGDMAFDGSNNLWILCSSSSQYALYKIRAPLPTTVQASVTVDTMIAVTATPASVSFTGIAFNSSGKLYLSTGSWTVSPGVAGNNKLYLLSSISAPLVTIGTLTNGYGDDLTSCSYPTFVLPVTWLGFKAELKNSAVSLSWKVYEDRNVSGYDVQTSTDGDNWETITHINSKNTNTDGIENEYHFTDKNYKTGIVYYRIKQFDLSGKTSFSGVKLVNTSNTNKIYIGPNPAKDVVYIFNRDNASKYLAQIFDRSGRLVSATVIEPSQQSINVSQLNRGVYTLKLSSSSVSSNAGAYQFVKW